jgi:hypothetical protein
MTKPRKTKIPLSLIVPIVGDGAMAAPAVADGRLLPVVIVDSSARREVSEVIRVHAHLQPGDVFSQWASSRDNDDHVLLNLKFVQPMEVELALLFSIERQAILVETILRGGAVYLQAGTAGDRVSTTMDAPRVLVEIPETGFRPRWDELFLSRMMVVMSRQLRISRRRARPVTEAFISQIRQLAGLRIGPIG